MKYKVFVAGGRAVIQLAETEAFEDAVSLAYAECGWVEDEAGNEIDILNDDGEPLFPEYAALDENDPDENDPDENDLPSPTMAGQNDTRHTKGAKIMENKKMHEVIVSTSIRFSDTASVAAYKALPWEDLPEDDMWYTEVTRYIVGYRRIILFGATGRRLAVFNRRGVTGMAVDGEPVVISGPDFKRIGIEEALQDSGYFVGEDETADTVDEAEIIAVEAVDTKA